MNGELSSSCDIASKRTIDPILMSIAICGILLYAGGVVFPNSYDNDVWFFLATGESIVEHGIPYTNPFSIQEGLGFIAQQWLHCVISYGLYSLGGFVALGIWTVVLFLFLAASVFVLGCRLRGSWRGSQAVMVVVAVCVIAASAYASMRPHLYSMLAFVWIVWSCESYRRTLDHRFLIALPLITCLHVNLHAAIAPYDLFIIACYAVPDLLKPFHRRGKLLGISLAETSYPRLPLLIAMVVSAFALLVNPYGIEGALYLVLSFDAASYGDRIKEMGPFVPRGDAQDILNTVLMFAAVLVVGRMGAKRIDLPLVALALFSIVETLAYLRNQWISALFCCLLLIWVSRHMWIGAFEDALVPRMVGAFIVLAGVIGMFALGAATAPELESMPEDGPNTPVRSVDYLESIGVDPQTTKAFTFFNAGGYLEYRGFKVNIDPRPEIWESAINGVGEDLYQEYVKMAEGDTAFDAYEERYDFDVFFVNSAAGIDDHFQSDGYVEIQGGIGYRTYAKKSWLDQYV